MKDKLSFMWYNMIIPTGGWRVGGVGGVGGCGGVGGAIYMGFQAVWVQMSENTRPLSVPFLLRTSGKWMNECESHSQAGSTRKYLKERDHKIYTALQSMGRQVIFFSYVESGPGGIFWPKRDDGRHLEHPEKVGFLTERGRQRVKEWRLATFMKE